MLYFSGAENEGICRSFKIHIYLAIYVLYVIYQVKYDNVLSPYYYLNLINFIQNVKN